MKLNLARLTYQKDTGTSVEVTEKSLRDILLEEVLGDTLFGLLQPQEWMYRLRWGPVDPEYGFAEKSLGAALFSLAQAAAGGFGAYRREKRIALIPVSVEWAGEHYPEASWLWDDSEPEDDGTGSMPARAAKGTEE